MFRASSFRIFLALLCQLKRHATPKAAMEVQRVASLKGPHKLLETWLSLLLEEFTCGRFVTLAELAHAAHPPFPFMTTTPHLSLARLGPNAVVVRCVCAGLFVATGRNHLWTFDIGSSSSHSSGSSSSIDTSSSSRSSSSSSCSSSSSTSRNDDHSAGSSNSSCGQTGMPAFPCPKRCLLPCWLD